MRQYLHAIASEIVVLIFEQPDIQVQTNEMAEAYQPILISSENCFFYPIENVDATIGQSYYK